MGVRLLNVIPSLGFCPLAFQRRILNCSTAKTRAATTKTKHEVENRLFFIFWVRCNLLRDLSGSRRSIFKHFYIIRFVFPLAFQHRIRKCSTAKTRAATTKTKHKVENDGSAFLHFLGSLKLISRFLRLQTSDF